MKRREFVEKLGIGSATLAAAGALGSVVSSASGSQHDHSTLDGPLASATVAFGSWVTEPALDRFPNNSPRTANNHKVLPYNTTIKAGGSVTFNISGTHQVLVYAPGTTLESITRTIVEAVPPPTPPATTPPPFPGFINDPVNRIYRGLDPRPLPQDRQETVTFAEKGTHLVVCGLVPHFDEGMHGFVKVV
jgi:plastocyanin